MPEINMPEVKLPDVKLPDGLRNMTKDDIVEAARDVRLPKDMKLPRKIEMPDIDLSGIQLPDAIADRLPGRRRTNPLIPLLALTIVGLVVVAAWWLFTSATTGPRVRRAVDDLRSRMNGESNDMIRYDDETNLGSLLDQDRLSSTDLPYASEPFGTNQVGEMGYDDAGVAVGPGATSDEEAKAPLA
jgi:hypothetical protein